MIAVFWIYGLACGAVSAQRQWLFLFPIGGWNYTNFGRRFLFCCRDCKKKKKLGYNVDLNVKIRKIYIFEVKKAMPKIADIQETPNPNAVKFILKEPISHGTSHSFKSEEDAEKDKIAKSIFDVGDVLSVF